MTNRQRAPTARRGSTVVQARTVLALIGLGLALLCGCTTAIAGEPTAVGDPQRTTEAEPTEQPEETEETEDTEPAPSSPEQTACDFVAEAFPGVGLLVGVAVFEETSGLFPVPTETRESVAQVLDAILVDTQPMLDALPAGAIRDAFIQSRSDSALLRDAMRAPATGPLVDTVDDGFVAAFQAMQTACQAS